jgi:hypothetical protein
MPREAIRLGAAQQVLPLERIGPRLEQMVGEPPTALPPKPERETLPRR